MLLIVFNYLKQNEEFLSKFISELLLKEFKFKTIS
jgi:hypothetical protein